MRSAKHSMAAVGGVVTVFALAAAAFLAAAPHIPADGLRHRDTQVRDTQAATSPFAGFRDFSVRVGHVSAEANIT